MSLTKVSFSMIEGAWAYPKDYGAVGDGVADDTAALQLMASESTYINLGDSDKEYLIDGSITLQSGTTVVAGGAKIRQSANKTEILNIVGLSDISISGVHFIGVGSDFVNSDADPSATALLSDGGEERINVVGNTFENFGYAGIRFKGADTIQIIDNVFIGPGSPILTPVTSGQCYGILTDTGCTKVVISGNAIKEYAQGLRIEGTKDVTITGNVITDIIGQHGVYVGSQVENVTIVGNTVLRTDLIGIKVQAQNGGTANFNITISGNTIVGCGDQGINITHGAGGTPQPIQNNNVMISGNTISDITATGINLQNIQYCTVGNNAINTCGGSGITASAVDFLDVSNNTILSCQFSGIRDGSPCTNVCISDNVIHNCAIGNNAGDNYGIFIQDGSGLEISSNTITDNAGGMLTGIRIAGGSQPSQSVFNNQIFNSTGVAITFASTTTAMAMYKNNVLLGTGGASSNNPALPSVASASNVELLTAHNIFKITGTTGITSIGLAGHSGHVVTLIFADVVTVTDGSNLKLAGNFTSTADDTLTLACDGNYWYEVSRSAN